MEHPTDLLIMVFIYGTSHIFTYNGVYLWNIPQIYLYLCLYFQILHQDLLSSDYAFPSSPSKKSSTLEEKV